MNSRTIKNVDDFFEHEYEKYVASATMQGLIRSPEISDMPRGGTIGNSQLDKFTNMAHASVVVAVVNAAIQGIPERHGRQYLEWRLEGRTWLEIEQLSGYSSAQARRNLIKAYEMFAFLMDNNYPGLLKPFNG